MNGLEVIHVPCLRDNYAWLLRDAASGKTAIVDPSESAPPLKAAGERGIRFDYVINTHHHPDHVGGNLEIKRETGCSIVGPAHDRDRIPGIDIALSDGERWKLGESEAEILFVPGHTRGHVAFWFAGGRALFCGDTLFSLGCGRMFEGTPPQMWSSLCRLRDLPAETLVYCGHEYTQANARFALSVDPDNQTLIRRSRAVDETRAKGLPTVPSPMGEERAANPFLRADDPGIAARLGLADAKAHEVFAELRERKNRA